MPSWEGLQRDRWAGGSNLRPGQVQLFCAGRKSSYEMPCPFLPPWDWLIQQALAPAQAVGGGQFEQQQI